MTIRVVGSVVEVNGQLIEKMPKTAAGERLVAIPEAIAFDLRRHLRRWSGHGRDGRVFPSPSGEVLRRSNFARRQWHEATKAAGLTGLHFHDLRHAAGTWAAESGATIRESMEFLGHTSPRAALIYQNAAQERARKIADALTKRAHETRAEIDRARKGHEDKSQSESS
jgi:integrase